jgi:multisubunit Na+/H+ antiporter MnhB subunit
MKTNNGMTFIVKTVTRVSVWLILLYGIYIILHGHLTPGGGFGGGVVIALAFLNVLLAFGKDFTEKWLKIELLKDIESSSVTIYLVVAILGIAIGGSFVANFLYKGELFDLYSSGTILVFNLLIGIKVGMSLFLVVWLLAGLKLDKEDDE